MHIEWNGGTHNFSQRITHNSQSKVYINFGIKFLVLIITKLPLQFSLFFNFITGVCTDIVFRETLRQGHFTKSLCKCLFKQSFSAIIFSGDRYELPLTDIGCHLIVEDNHHKIFIGKIHFTMLVPEFFKV